MNPKDGESFWWKAGKSGSVGLKIIGSDLATADEEGPTLLFDSEDCVWQRDRKGLLGEFIKVSNVDVPGMTNQQSESFWMKSELTVVDTKLEALNKESERLPPGPPTVYLLQSGDKYEFKMPGKEEPEQCIKVKVGVTYRGVNRRIRELQTGNPSLIQELCPPIKTGEAGSDEGYRRMWEAEKDIHQRYRDYGGPYCDQARRELLALPQAATEWFVFSESKLAEIVAEYSRRRVLYAEYDSAQPSSPARRRQRLE